MFIKNGKSLFGNTGLIISLIILCVLLYFSYNKCYIGPTETFDCITDPTDPICMTTIPAPVSTPIPTTLLKTPPPKSVIINITGVTVTVNFTIDYTSKLNIPISKSVGFITSLGIIPSETFSKLANNGCNSFQLFLYNSIF